MKINVKTSSGGKFTMDVDNMEETILDFKGRLADLSGVPKESQRVIYRGHVLKDQQTMNDLVSNLKLEDGHTMHLVRGAASKAPAPTTGATPTGTPAAAAGGTTPAAAGAMPGAMPGVPGAFPGMGGNMFSPENFDPQMIREIMDTPMMRTLTDNPELMRQMILANPEIEQLRQQSPEIAHLFNDPNTFRSAVEAARNPSLMNEMLRNTDRQMANIEMTPGGFDALRNLYQNVQAPLMDATRNNNDNTANTQGTNTAGGDQNANPFASLFNNNTPSTQPMPNPWNPTPAANTGAATGTGTRAMPGAGGAPGTGAGADMFANAFGGMGGAGGMPGMPGMEGMDPQAMLQTLQNPAVQQMMETVFANPQMMEQIAQNNPMMQNLMRENPTMGNLMRDPTFLRNMMNPQTLQSWMQLRSVLDGQGAGGGVGTGTTPGAMPGATGAAPATETRDPTQPPSATPSANQTNNAQMNAFAQMLQGMTVNPQQQQPQLTPEQAEERKVHSGMTPHSSSNSAGSCDIRRMQPQRSAVRRTLNVNS